jgi:hypothetical protein
MATMKALAIPAQYAERLSIRDGELHVLCPAGMGDFAWIWAKWWSVAAQRYVKFWFPEDEQQRAWPLAEALGANYDHLPGLTTEWVWEQDGNPPIPDSGERLVVHANKHLENGFNLEKWYPDLPLRYPTMDAIKPHGYNIETNQCPAIVVFPCQHGYMEKGGNLLPGQWARMCQEIEHKIGPVCLVGAGNDVQLIKDICEIYSPLIKPVLDKPLTRVLAGIRGARGMVAAASGLSILSTYMGVPTMHLYPRWLVRMPGRWEQPDAVSDWRFLDEGTLPDTVDKLAELIARAK